MGEQMTDCDRCGQDIYTECHCHAEEMSKRIDKLEKRIDKLEKVLKAQALVELTRLSEEMGLYE